MRRTETHAVRATPPLVQWRAVFAGGLIGLAMMIMLTTLWLALAFGSEMETVAGSLEWYIGGTAIFSLFVAGMLAGWLSGIPSAAAGMFNGLTVWGLVLIVSLAAGVPSVLNVIGTDTAPVRFGSDAAWSVFWSMLIGFGTAGIGGLIGGAMPRPARATTEVGTTEGDLGAPSGERAEVEQRRVAS